MKCIVNVDQAWGIGCKGKLLNYIPEDLAHFKQTTLNKVVVMGYNTLMSFRKQQPLKNRTNIIFSRKPNLKVEDAIVCGSLSEFANIMKEYNTDDVYVIGGESIYRLLLPYCSEAIVTKVDATFNADTFFPNLEDEHWKSKITDQKFYKGDLSARVIIYYNQHVKQLEKK